MPRRTGRRPAKKRTAARAPTARVSAAPPAPGTPPREVQVQVALAVVRALKARLAHRNPRTARAAQRALRGLLRDQPEELTREFGLAPAPRLGRRPGTPGVHFRQSGWILTALHEGLSRDEILRALGREPHKANQSWLARREKRARAVLGQPDLADWARNLFRRPLHGLGPAEQRALILQSLRALQNES